MSSDLLIMQGTAGDAALSDGSTATLRLGKRRELINSQAHGKYREAAVRGRLFIQSVKTATVTATTDISPIPATTGRALVGVLNPISSGFKASILKIGMSTVSGTPGGPFYLDVVPNCGVAAALAASSTPISASTLAQAGSACRGLAAAVPAQAAVGTMLRPLGGPAAIATGAGVYDVTEDIDGSIELPENSLLVVTAHATGTSHVVSGYILWEEIPI